MNTITLSDEQLHIVSRALDVYSRLSIGQFKYSTDVPTVQKRIWNLSELERDEFENIMLRACEIMTGLPKHGNFGIHNKEVGDDARVAAHIYQTIRHFEWSKEPEDKRYKYTVNAYPADMVKGLIIKLEETK